VTDGEYSQPAPTATATSTIMSSVRARSARTAPSKKIQHDQKITGRLSSSIHTSSRSPNGAATVKPSTSRPIGDHNRIGTEKTAATRNRLRMSATIAAIAIPACPPWPTTSSRERTASASDGAWPACAPGAGGARPAWAAGPAGSAVAGGTGAAGAAAPWPAWPSDGGSGSSIGSHTCAGTDWPAQW
jgi:hypothetical protein